MIKVYFRIDERNRVYPWNDWREDIVPPEDVLLGEIDAPIYAKYDVPCWKWDGTTCERRTDAEIQEDIDAVPLPDPTPEEILRADVDYLLMLADEEVA